MAANIHNAQEQGEDESNRLAAIRALPWYRRPSIGWLLPFVFLAVLVIGISQAPQEQLIIRIVCKEYFKERETLSGGGTMMTALLGSNEVPRDPCDMPEVVGFAAVVLGRVKALKYTSGTDLEGGVIFRLNLPWTRSRLDHSNLNPTFFSLCEQTCKIFRDVYDRISYISVGQVWTQGLDLHHTTTRSTDPAADLVHGPSYIQPRHRCPLCRWTLYGRHGCGHPSGAMSECICW